MATHTINVSDTLHFYSKKLGFGARYDYHAPALVGSSYYSQSSLSLYVPAQIFTTSFSYKICGINFIAVRRGNPGITTVSIRNVNSVGSTTGSDLCSGTVDLTNNPLTLADKTSPFVPPSTFGIGYWNYVSFTIPYQLEKNKKYSIVIRSQTNNSENYLTVRALPNISFSSLSHYYKYGYIQTISNLGNPSTQNHSTDYYFETWGIDGSLNDPNPLNIYVNDYIQLLEPSKLSITAGLNTKYEPT